MKLAKWPYLLSLTVAAVLTGCHGQARSGATLTQAGPARADSSPGTKRTGIAWFNGPLESAFAQAQAVNRPVLVFWSAQWCPYCQALKATVFTRADFVEESRHVIAVDLDGDQPEGEKWGREFKVIGYPTLLIFRPDRTELARVSGGMDLNQYAATLARVIADERPIAEVLAGAIRQSPARISSDVCRRLPYHAWDLEPDAENPPPERANQLTIVADRCPAAERIPRARLTMRALALTLQRESDALQHGTAPTAELVTRLKQLMPLLTDPQEVEGTGDILASLDDSLYTAIKCLGPQFSDSFHQAWRTAMLALAHDARYGESDRLLALATALDSEEALRPDHTVPADLAAEARARVATALSGDAASASRHDIVNAARIVYTVLGQEQALYDLLIREIPKSATPYYYMPVLASIEEKRGHTGEALAWLERAFAATHTAGAKAKWGQAYLKGLIRMRPDDTQTIKVVAIQVVDAIHARDALLEEKTPDRAQHFVDSLAKWATTPTRQAVLVSVKERFAT
jgi:protein disulfide-isomerase